MTLLDTIPSIVEQRVRAVAPHLLPQAAPDELDHDDVAQLLQRLLGAAHADPAPDRLWLLMTALAGCFPDEDTLRQATRTMARHHQLDATLWLLDTALELSVSSLVANRPIEVVAHGVVVDVTYSAQHDLHTGIQRVVRSTLPHWVAGHDLVPAVFADDGASLRRLRPSERDRVLSWSTRADDGVRSLAELLRRSNEEGADDVLVVPWHSTLVLLEVPGRAACERIATIGQWTPNRVAAVGYDCIPIVSSLMVPIAEPNRFVHYLTTVKWMTAMAGISVSATEEFRGFGRMLGAQGLRGPEVTECVLPAASGPAPLRTTSSPDEPLVLCVGSFEPRKNQAALLYAAEVLWREGLRFRLQFIGGSGWWTDFTREVERSRRHGRPVEHRRAVSESDLEDAYANARFTVFISQHEGYGLPVAESLERGVPVLTSDVGSMRELSAAGGTIAVDPRDDDAIVAALRRLLTDDALCARLQAEITARPTRTWADYASELWEHLVERPADVRTLSTPAPVRDVARV